MKQLTLKIASVLFAFTILLSTATVNAQSLDETLQNLSNQAAEAYVQPIIPAFGSNLNSGWFSGSPGNTLLGFTLNVKVFAAGSFLAGEAKNFSVSAPFRFTSPQVEKILNNSGIFSGMPGYDALKNKMLSQAYTVKLSGPTVIGSKDEHLQIEFPGETINGVTVGSATVDVNEVTGLLDNLSIFPTPGIQLNVGTIYGTQAAFRWLPSVDIKDLGKFSFFGFGILHNINSWIPIPLLPVDFSVGYFTQKLKVGDIFESKATQFGLYVSQQFGIGLSVTPYAGVTYETSTTTVNYDYVFDTPVGPTTQHISFDLEGKNKLALTLGARLNIFFFNIAADYKIGAINTATASIFFGF